MATVVLAPTYGVGYQSFTANGLPNNGGFINSYAAGSSTPTATYTTSVGNVQNANPIQLNSDGRPPAEIWLIQGTSYKFILTDSLGNILKTDDNIPGINDASALQGTIPIAQGGTGQTTTNAALDALYTSQAFVTSAATLNLDAVSSSYVQVLGNTGITAVTLTNGRERTLEFNSTVAISSNSTLILPGGTTITAVAGDTAILRGEASSVVRAVVFQKASGAPNNLGTLSNALVANVSCNSTSLYFTGPSVTQGTAGTWYAAGTVTLFDTAVAGVFTVKLWDGTTVASSAVFIIRTGTPGDFAPVTLCGVFINPTGNIRMSVKAGATTGAISFNASGESRDSSIVALRIG